VRYTINRKTKSYTICVSFSVSARNTQRNTFCAFKKATERYTFGVSSSISKDILLLYSIEKLVKKNKTYIFFWCFLGLHLAVPAVPAIEWRSIWDDNYVIRCFDNPPPKSSNFLLNYFPLYHRADRFRFRSSGLKSTRHWRSLKELTSDTLVGEARELSRPPTYVRSLLLLDCSTTVRHLQLSDVHAAIRNIHTIDFDMDEHDIKGRVTRLIDSWGVTLEQSRRRGQATTVRRGFRALFHDFHSTLRDCLGLSGDSLHCVEAKLARGQCKLSADAPRFSVVEHEVSKPVDKITGILVARREELQSRQRESPPWNPNLLDTHSDTWLSLDRSRDYIFPRLSQCTHEAPSSDFVSTEFALLMHTLRGLNDLTSANLSAALPKDPITALIYLEHFVASDYSQWVANRRLDESACVFRSQCIDVYAASPRLGTLFLHTKLAWPAYRFTLCARNATQPSSGSISPAPATKKVSAVKDREMVEGQPEDGVRVGK